MHGCQLQHRLLACHGADHAASLSISGAVQAAAHGPGTPCLTACCQPVLQHLSVLHRLSTELCRRPPPRRGPPRHGGPAASGSYTGSDYSGSGSFSTTDSAVSRSPRHRGPPPGTSFELALGGVQGTPGNVQVSLFGSMWHLNLQPRCMPEACMTSFGCR